MNRLKKRLNRRLSERGQVLVLVAGMLPVLLGMTGLAVDVATYAGDRRALQNAADSIALAASHELPDGADTQAVADEWAAKNNIDADDITITVSGGTTAPKVRVEIERPHRFFFLRALGVEERQIGAGAAAVKVSFGGGAGIVPWSITEDTLDWAGNGDEVVMKYDATGAENGNFGAIRIDGPGADTYETSVRYGSSTVACAEPTPNCAEGACPGTYPENCSETSPTCDGPECDPQTGNVIGPTKDAVDFRKSHTNAECDTFEEAFGTEDAEGKFHLNPDCNPWLDGPGKCTSDTDMCSRRVIIIPVVDEFGSGVSDPATIMQFALFWLEGYDDGKCQGNACEIKGRFVAAELTTGALAGVFDESAPIQFTRLSE